MRDLLLILLLHKADLILPVAVLVDMVTKTIKDIGYPLAVIGVDAKQELTDSNKTNNKFSNTQVTGDRSKPIRFSIIKNLDIATTKMLENAKNAATLAANAQPNAEIDPADEFKLGVNTVAGLASNWGWD